MYDESTDERGFIMLYRNIMVAFDGSEPAKEALVVAKNMIGDDGQATMHVVSVVSIGSLGLGGDLANSPTPGMQQIFPDMRTYDEAIDNAKKAACGQMRDAAENLMDGVECNVTFDAVVAVKPAAGICDYAEDHKVDMIVMGRRGLGALRAMLGSVSYAVLHETSIPVVTVK